METLKSGTGHGMPQELPESVARRIAEQEEAKRKQQTEKFANNSLPTRGTTVTTIHDSKHFPFQIIEITTTFNDVQEPIEEKQFRVGMCGQFMSEKAFASKQTAEKYISARPWELITNMVCLTIHNAFEYEKSKSNN